MYNRLSPGPKTPSIVKNVKSNSCDPHFAIFRRADLKISNLESDFKQKSDENAELCKIADELISKSGV